MGYFEGISSRSFKKDTDGRTVFYPIGILGKGRVLPDQPTEERIRVFLIRYYRVSLSLVIVLAASVRWIWAAALIPVLWLWFYVGIRPLIAGLPQSPSKLTLKESFVNSAAAHSKGLLWAMFVGSGLFVLGGVVILSRSRNTEDALIGLSSIAFFGVCSCAFGYMLRARRA